MAFLPLHRFSKIRSQGPETNLRAGRRDFGFEPTGSGGKPLSDFRSSRSIAPATSFHRKSAGSPFNDRRFFAKAPDEPGRGSLPPPSVRDSLYPARGAFQPKIDGIPPMRFETIDDIGGDADVDGLVVTAKKVYEPGGGLGHSAMDPSVAGAPSGSMPRQGPIRIFPGHRTGGGESLP